MSKSKLRLGISPCPNDTFIFHALTHGLLDDTELDFEIEVEHHDVEALNQKAMEGYFDICKLSYATIGKVLDQYQLLRSGGAMGKGVGPLLIAGRDMSEDEIDEASIAIPGENTTANFLLSLAYPRANHRIEMLFSEIEDAILNDKVDAGLVIHEGRFTYEEKGLIALMDLGNYWEEVSSELIPLGGIVVKRDLPEAQKKVIERLISESVQYAFDHPEASKAYVKEYADEMEDEVIQKHIDLYVNQYSVNVGEAGATAIKTFFEKAREKELIPQLPKQIFIS